MTTLPVDDRAMESALADLALTAPPNLAADVLVEVGLADRYATIESPIGPLYVAWNGRGVSTVGLAADDDAFEAEHVRQTGRTAHRAAAIPEALAGRISRRIAGDRRADVRVDLRGRSPFERDVLLKAAEIPYGEVRPYGWIAAEIGRPKAVRAVGTALGHNPVPLIVPCHRVVRTDGSIGQYSLGGPQNKRTILASEGPGPRGLRAARAGRRALHRLAHDAHRVQPDLPPRAAGHGPASRVVPLARRRRRRGLSAVQGMPARVGSGQHPLVAPA